MALPVRTNIVGSIIEGDPRRLGRHELVFVEDLVLVEGVDPDLIEATPIVAHHIVILLHRKRAPASLHLAEEDSVAVLAGNREVFLDNCDGQITFFRLSLDTATT